MAAVGTAEGGMDPALYKAATQGCAGNLRKLVVKDVKILNSKTPQRNTALHLAALHGHPKFAREVLAVSEELIVAKNADGDTALHLAAKTGRLKVAELLVVLARGWPEDPNSEDALLKSPLIATNKEGNNPLHEAGLRHLEAFPSTGEPRLLRRLETTVAAGQEITRRITLRGGGSRPLVTLTQRTAEPSLRFLEATAGKAEVLRLEPRP